MFDILKKLFILYCILICSIFGAGYLFGAMENVGLFPSSPTNWKDK